MRISDWSSDVCSSDLLSEQNRRFSIGPARIDKDAAKNLTMVNARYTGVDELGRPFSLTAHNARQENARSEYRLVGKDCVCTFRSRLSPYHYKNKLFFFFYFFSFFFLFIFFFFF